MTKILTPFFLIAGFLFLAAGWALSGNWPVGLFLVLLPLGLLLLKRIFPAALSLALALAVFLAAFGLWRELNLPLAVGGVLCVLAAWDLEHFSRQLVFANAENGQPLIERQHLLQLGVVLGLGLGISVLSQSIRIVFNFEWAVVLAVVTFAGISSLVGWLRNKES